MEISIHIVPSEVLTRVQQGTIDLNQYKSLSDDLDKLIVKLIVKEIRRRFTFKMTDYFQALMKRKQVPPFIKQLIDMGWINRKGHLMEEASINDLLTGKYHEQFERLMPRELLQEGIQICETIKTCFAMDQDDTYSLIQNAKKRHALLEITIREAKPQ